MRYLDSVDGPFILPVIRYLLLMSSSVGQGSMPYLAHSMSVKERVNLPEVRALRSRLREVFTATNERQAAASLNAVLQDVSATPRVSVHGKRPPHLHFEPEGGSPARWLGAVGAMGLTTALIEGGFERFGRCASTTCDDVFVDTSRNRSRLHCSDSCTTRESVAAYRRRQRTS